MPYSIKVCQTCINPGTTRFVFSCICLTRYNSQLKYSICINPDKTLLYSSGIYVSRYNLIPLVNTRGIKPFHSVIRYQFRNPSVFFGYLCFKIQLIVIPNLVLFLRESDSGRFSFAKQEVITITL